MARERPAAHLPDRVLRRADPDHGARVILFPRRGRRGLAPLRDETGKLDLNIDSYTRFFTEPIYFEIFVKSVIYAGATTLICLLLGYPLAALIARRARKHRDLL